MVSTAQSNLASAEGLMQSVHPPSSHTGSRIGSQSQDVLGSHSKPAYIRPCLNVPEYSDEGSLESQVKSTGSLPWKHPGAQERNYSIKPQPVLKMVTDLPPARLVVPSPDAPPHLRPPKLPYNPYKRDPTALSPLRISPHGQMPSDPWLTESLPPRLYDTPIDWNMVRQASMQRSLINPFAEPRRRRVTREMLQLHIPPETWYGAGLACSMAGHPESDVSTSAWSPSMLVSSMGAALHALRSPIRNAWSPVYTREELLRQQEEQAPPTFLRDDNCTRPVYPSLDRVEVGMHVRKSAPLSYSIPRKLQEATADAHFKIEPNSSTVSSPPQPQPPSQLPAGYNSILGQHASTKHTPAHLVNDSDTMLYGSRFNPSYKRCYSSRTPTRTLRAATTAKSINCTVSTPESSCQITFHTVKRAAMFMRADRRNDAHEAMETIRQWLEQRQVQDFLIAVGVWATVVVLLKWLDVSPPTTARIAPTRAEVFKDWGFSYVRVSEERLWSVGEQQ
ncbi:hypothetical protein Cpir12675_003735 [Ceratocystis pirilliformis]|uniref:Uncharacterized protein n=1 Tax=Ceratocystis pirilliformis TaxID=259994 RepID=A0ABR3Z296_9PEZI